MMGTVDDVTDKVKAKITKGRGRLKQQSPSVGDKLSGTFDEVRGSVQDTLADVKLKTKKDSY